MENVFGGVHISTDDEVRAHVVEPDLRPRPWLAGLTMSAVQVSLGPDHEDDDQR
ncbi:MAG: hypothetical protein ACRD15_10155 [Vicinamibacterales bacterium]